MEPLLQTHTRPQNDAKLCYQLPKSLRLRGGAEGGGGGEASIGIGCCSTFCVVVILPLFAFNCLTAVVKPNHAGLKKDVITNRMDLSTTYAAGRHWFQPFTQFVLFPTTVQSFHLELTARTTEGYPLTLKADVQYQLMPDKIPQIYARNTIRYEPVLNRNARAELMKAMSEYDARALFEKRVDILKDMEVRVDRVLRESYATCWGVQFDDVMQPAAFERTLLMTQLQEWFSKQKLAEQRISAIEAKTQVLQAEFNKNISVVSSTATAKCKYITSQATAHSSNYQNEAKSNSTLMTDKAKADGSVIERETHAAAELRYQQALAHGDSAVLKEKAEATMRHTKLQGLRLGYWKSEIQLSSAGLVQFQKLLGSYERLQNVTFLFGFGNAYASADASPAGTSASSSSLSKFAQMASVVTQNQHAKPEL